MRKVMEYGLERIFYLENIAGNVRVTEKMFPRLFRYGRWGSQILAIDEPEIYVAQNPIPNAWTYGDTRPFVVLTSGLLDLLDEEERFYVVGHELGHIKCSHALYTLVADNIATIISAIGQATLGVGSILGMGLELALFDWRRKAELSADRAGLLCVQSEEVAMRVFMKLAGGTQKLSKEMDLDEFLRQIRAYEMTNEALDKAYKVFITAFRSHPFPILRAAHLDRWITTGAYGDLLLRGSKPLGGG
ncbi:MAG: M48 family metallopeptidase [Deltaproteobacteria bacterium]|nr:M48 family metallopeptidase [Deltaproteobacteria bacterium]